MKKPNLILLTIDTLRADVLGCYGYDPSITPNMDRMAASGIRFEQAVTGGSWTQAAFPVLLTSSYASSYGGCLGPLAPERPSPIEALAAHGYSTGGFSTSPLLSRNYGYDRGFRHFVDLVPNEADPPLRRIKGGERLLRNPLTHYVSGLMGKRTRPARIYVSGAELTDSFDRWLEDIEAPFFAWLHYMDVHWPYHREEMLTCPREIAQAWTDLAHLHGANWNGKTISAAQREHYIRLYEHAVQYTDTQIGRLIENLSKLGHAANTIIILVSDHGEEFLERRHWGHFETNLCDEILKVPLIIYLPDRSEGHEIQRQVRTMDIMPTILELCGCLPIPGLEGASLVPLWTRDEAEYEVEISISEMWRDERHIIALRTETFKYIWDSRRPNQPELFDLRADPKEQFNVYEQHPEQAKQFQSYVDTHLLRMAQTMPATRVAEPEIDDEILRRLRDLGYME